MTFLICLIRWSSLIPVRMVGAARGKESSMSPCWCGQASTAFKVPGAEGLHGCPWKPVLPDTPHPWDFSLSVEVGAGVLCSCHLIHCSFLSELENHSQYLICASALLKKFINVKNSYLLHQIAKVSTQIMNSKEQNEKQDLLCHPG